MNRRRFVLGALTAAARGPGAVARVAASFPRGGVLQAPVGVTGIDYFPVYYAWYDRPRRWDANQDYLPALDRYRSDQPGLIGQHLGWLQANGGAGFAVNWHGPSGFVNETLHQQFLPALSGFPGLEFCIHYDPYIRWGLPMPDFTRDAAAAATWRGDARHIARTLMSHPQYARVDGRPLLFVYLTRAIEGLTNLEAFVDIARDEAAKAGHGGVYLVLGEIWWIPTDETPVNLEIIRSIRAPRTRIGDAVYSYNLATEPERERVWRGNIRTFLGEAGRVYKDYRNLMDERGAAGKQVITTLMPRFDNTVLRIHQGRPPGMNIGPWRGYGGVDFEADMATVLDKLSTSFEPVRGGSTIALVTSWNEWPERSALEPSRAGIDKDGLPTPGDAYLTGLSRAVAEFSPLRDPVLRPGGLSRSSSGGRRAPRGGRPRDRAEAELQAVDAALQVPLLTAEQTEHVTVWQVSGGRVAFRSELRADRR